MQAEWFRAGIILILDPFPNNEFGFDLEPVLLVPNPVPIEKPGLVPEPGLPKGLGLVPKLVLTSLYFFFLK